MNKKKEQRRRLARPRALIVFGVIYVFMPLVNYYAVSLYYNIKFTYPGLIFGELNWFELFLLFGPFVVGIGLLSVRKWGWWSFLAYSTALIVYNLAVFILNPGYYNLGAIVQAFFGSLMVMYFIRKDISAPYFKMYPRGWRLEPRKPIQIELKVDNLLMKTRDISLSGFYVDWHKCPYRLGDEVSVFMERNGTEKTIDGGIVRIDEDGVGIAFRKLARDHRKFLKELL